MQRLLRWAGLALAGLVTLVLFAGLGAFAASEVILRLPDLRPQPARFTAASTPEAVARGRRVATLNGCHDCHGARLEGRLFHDDPKVLRAWGPNLTLAAAEQSDGELERAIRHGVAADGAKLWVMPSEAFARLTDAETADLIAYVRSFPRRGERQPDFQVGPAGRIGLLLGMFHSAPHMVETQRAVELPRLGPEHEAGRALARACVECHGPDLAGREVMKAPDLTIAAAYDLADFATLMRTGRAAGDREVGLMSATSRTRFSGLTDAEVEALHGYLKARADKVL
jgi:mono/diheme cytochrome c family protein